MSDLVLAIGTADELLKYAGTYAETPLERALVKHLELCLTDTSPDTWQLWEIPCGSDGRRVRNCKTFQEALLAGLTRT